MRTIAWYINPERIAQFIGTKEALSIAEKIKDVTGIQFAGSEPNLYRMILKEKIEDDLPGNFGPLDS
ncbi:hypothetical protein [Desulfomicrobium escambiense]|uniref:hypothetical protein n=1 Tax=Desulfomicrobium escambiense TaxID=29503 RepID=UPI00146F9D23|nr:hypothetical protein [Desulfomicrobium escambiense]